jgi:hypothetical protein
MQAFLETSYGVFFGYPGLIQDVAEYAYWDFYEEYASAMSGYFPLGNFLVPSPGLKTPNALLSAQQHFGCPSLTHTPLEPGNPSHFSDRAFRVCPLAALTTVCCACGLPQLAACLGPVSAIPRSMPCTTGRVLRLWPAIARSVPCDGAQ